MLSPSTFKFLLKRRVSISSIKRFSIKLFVKTLSLLRRGGKALLSTSPILLLKGFKKPILFLIYRPSRALELSFLIGVFLYTFYFLLLQLSPFYHANSSLPHPSPLLVYAHPYWVLLYLFITVTTPVVLFGLVSNWLRLKRFGYHRSTAGGRIFVHPWFAHPYYPYVIVAHFLYFPLMLSVLPLLFIMVKGLPYKHGSGWHYPYPVLQYYWNSYGKDFNNIPLIVLAFSLIVYKSPLTPIGRDGRYDLLISRQIRGRFPKETNHFMYNMQDYVTMHVTWALLFLRSANFKLNQDRYMGREIAKHWNTNPRDFHRGERIRSITDLMQIVGGRSGQYRRMDYSLYFHFDDERTPKYGPLLKTKAPLGFYEVKLPEFYTRPRFEIYHQQEEDELREEIRERDLKRAGKWDEFAEREKREQEAEYRKVIAEEEALQPWWADNKTMPVDFGFWGPKGRPHFDPPGGEF